MILLDAYALVALLGEEPAAGEVEELLRTGDCSANVVNFAEAIDVSARVHGIALAEVRDALRALTLGGNLRLIDADEMSAWRAADLRQRYYAKKTSELSLADCFLLASASSADRIATPDVPVACVARAEGIEVIPLPDSSGRRP